MRLIGIVLTLLLAAAATTQAQVASPRLNPLLPYILARPNPAIQVWHEQSAVGLHYLSGTAKTVVGGTPVPNADVGAHVLQSRTVGDWYALSAELVNLNVDSAGTPLSETAIYRYDAAVQFADTVAIGFGQRQENEKPITPPGAPMSNTIKTYGLSVRMGEVFYAGYAQGESTDNAGAKANLARFGLAYRSDAFRTEVFHEQVDTALLPTPFAETDGYSVEAIFPFMLMGVEYSSTYIAPALQTETATLIHIGTMLGKNFVVGIGNTATSKTSPGANSQDINLMSVSLGWVY